MSRLAEIAQKREHLVARAAEQRRTIAEALSRLHAPLSLADRGVAWTRWAREHPVLIAVGVAALVAARPQLALRWAARGLALWRTGRFVLQLIRTVAARRAATADHPSGSSSRQS